MAFHRGPRIVYDDSLIALFDSQNIKSYPGTGNIWYDLSKYKNNATLYNFTGAGAGTLSGFDTNTSLMMFDRHVGSSDGAANNYALIPNNSLIALCNCYHGFSVSYWIKQTSLTCTAMTKMIDTWEIYYCSSLTFRTQGTGGNDGNSGLSNSYYLGDFHHITATHDGFYRKIYINGELYYTNANTITATTTTSPISIGAYNGGYYAFIGSLPYYALYNRVLSADEIKMIYNSTKSRFNNL